MNGKKNIILVLCLLVITVGIIKPALCPHSDVYGIHTLDECDDYHENDMVTRGGGGNWSD